MNSLTTPLTLIGHPLTPSGQGALIRTMERALADVDIYARVIDLFGDPSSSAEAGFADAAAVNASEGINVFCINGDEIDRAFTKLSSRDCQVMDAYNIVCPSWELPNYPPEWGRQLDRFDEIWVYSDFVRDSVAAATTRPVTLLPNAVATPRAALVSRPYFGLRDEDFVFLFAFDFQSYIDRKNPFAVIDAFGRACDSMPNAYVSLVLKTSHSSSDPAGAARLAAAVNAAPANVTWIDGTLGSLEMGALYGLSDCFVSLHRAEGFGFGIAEAMTLGKAVISTGWSGNLEFCDAITSRLVDYELVPVPEGTYPYWEGQVWAEPSIDDAAMAMAELAQDRSMATALGHRARVRMRRNHGLLTAGLRYADRLDEIADSLRHDRPGGEDSSQDAAETTLASTSR